MRESLDEIENLDAELLAVDPHESWSAKYLLKEVGLTTDDVQFPLLMDPSLTMSASYGIPSQMRIHTEWSSRPATFIIDKEGVIRYVKRGATYNDRPKPAEIVAELNKLQSHGDEAVDLDELKNSMTLYASFDEGIDADVALGDARLHTTSSMQKIREAEPGLGQSDRVVRVEGEGVRGGGALQFKNKGGSFPFFQGNENVKYSETDWEGTVSFCLKVDPAKNPGFNDPIQVTDASYKESAIWVDFTKDSPREFRLAVISDLQPNGQRTQKKNRVVPAMSMPFSDDNWTQVTITFSALNTDHGEAHVYFDGELQASVTGVDDPITIDLEKFKIQMGLGYVGLLDELVAFDRCLSPAEVRAFQQLEGGASSLVGD